MSFRVLVIPEDPTYNGAILHPLVTRVVAECGRPQAKVTVLTNPALGGIDDVRTNMPSIVERYAHMDLLICVVDADGRDRSDLFRQMENSATESGARLLCCAAVQEIEAWLLAGHLDKIQVAWQDIRADVSVKENVFVPFLRQYGDARRPFGGRDVLMQQTLTNYAGLLARCPELVQLETRIRTALTPARN